MENITFIGGGRITRILLQALHNAGSPLTNISIFDIAEAPLNILKDTFPDVKITHSLEPLSGADLIVLAVHPPVMMETLEKIKPNLSPTLTLLSLAPKFNISTIQSLLDGFPNVARMNPNAAAIVNKGMHPIAFAPAFNDQLKGQLLKLVQPFGNIPVVDDSKIEAYAVICAMGPTYFNFQLQKLKELAISFGMDEQEARSALAQMMQGTNETFFLSGLSYNEVIDLIPVKPMSEVENTIIGFYDLYLKAIYSKVKP